MYRVDWDINIFYRRQYSVHAIFSKIKEDGKELKFLPKLQIIFEMFR